jgi:hypothetical protein
MGDRTVHDAAIGREQRALERAARAWEHQKKAELEADEATDPDLARMHREEAETHRRAAQLHEQASKIQAAHARAHDGHETDE